MNKPLYQLTASFKEFEAMLDNSGSEFLTKEMIQECLDNIRVEIEEKIENTGKVFLGNKADITALDTEIKRLQARKDALNNQNEWLREYLLTEMKKVGLTKVKTPTLTVYISKSQESITVESPKDLPEEFQRIVIEADKKAIKEYYDKNQVVIPGAIINPGKEFVVIR